MQVVKTKQKLWLKKLKAKGVDSFAIQANVANGDEVKAMIKEVVSQFGSVDVLVNNAGITRDNLLMRMKEQEWDDVIDTNLKGVFNCIQKSHLKCYVNVVAQLLTYQVLLAQ